KDLGFPRSIDSAPPSLGAGPPQPRPCSPGDRRRARAPRSPRRAPLPRSMTNDRGRRERAPVSVPRTFLLLAAVACGLFALPLAGLVLRAPWDRAATELGTPEVREALRLSLVCSLSATALAVLLRL